MMIIVVQFVLAAKEHSIKSIAYIVALRIFGRMLTTSQVDNTVLLIVNSLLLFVNNNKLPIIATRIFEQE